MFAVIPKVLNEQDDRVRNGPRDKVRSAARVTRFALPFRLLGKVSTGLGSKPESPRQLQSPQGLTLDGSFWEPLLRCARTTFHDHRPCPADFRELKPGKRNLDPGAVKSLPAFRSGDRPRFPIARLTSILQR